MGASVDEEPVGRSPTEVETDWESAVKSELVETGEADWCEDEQLGNGCGFVVPPLPGVTV